MTKNKTRKKIGRIKGAVPYVVAAAVIIGVAAIGTFSKESAGATLDLEAFVQNDYKVSVDQMSELYMVADISDALGLASASDVASNYVLTTSMYDAGQTTAGKIEKPSITNIAVSRGVIEHTVAEGESLDAIAARYKVSTDQIRWSNGLKTTDVSAGTVLYIPSVAGIVYTVKGGDTVESIAAKYGSSVSEIIALNDLEVSGISEGMRIVIKDGALPETERPEYVAPRPVYRTNYYTYLGSTSERQDITILYNRFYGAGGGQCVHWAYYNRPDLHELYGWSLGNANTWAARATRSVVNRTPSVGAIFQTSSGWYGHVGYVEAVNPDGSIRVSEMNYGYVSYRVIESTIPASAVGNFYYIH